MFNKNIYISVEELYELDLTFEDLMGIKNNPDLDDLENTDHFCTIYDLYCYAQKLNQNKEYLKANKCLNKCLTASNLNDILFSGIEYAWQSNDYTKIYDLIFTYKNNNLDSNNNLILYLLSNFTNVPKKYSNDINSIKYEDLKIKSTDEVTRLQNKISLLIYQQRFSLATKYFAKLKEIKTISKKDLMIEQLLNKALTTQVALQKEFLKLITAENYQAVYEKLNNIQSQRKLSFYEKQILELVNYLLNFKNLNLANDIEQIKSLNLLEELTFTNDDNEIDLKVIHQLYQAINKQIQKEITSSKDISVDFVQLLQQNDYSKAFDLVGNYLKLLNKQKYIFIIVDLLKISLIENDYEFTKPLKFLETITSSYLEFDPMIFVKYFYQSLAEEKIPEAQIYLGILQKIDFYDIKDINLFDLENMLENYKNNFNYVCDLNLDNYLANFDEYANIFLLNRVTKVKNKCNDSDLINSKLDILAKNNLAIFEPMNIYARKSIHRVLATIPNIETFSIGSNNNRRVVIKFCTDRNEYPDYEKFLMYGKEKFQNEEYERAINIFNKILSCTNPPIDIYAYLGLAYMKTGNLKLAIDYFTLATLLTQKYNFNNIISTLKQNDNSLEEVESNVGTIDKFVNLVINGINFNTVVKYYKINEEQKLLIALKVAQYYYDNDNYIKGDDYLKQVRSYLKKYPYIYNSYQNLIIKKNKCLKKGVFNSGNN